MREILSRENLVEAMKKVELALVEALVETGIAPRKALVEAQKAADRIDSRIVYEEERKIGHEVAALVELLGRHGGREASRWIHYGATSNDIIDTAWSLVLREAISTIRGKLRSIVGTLANLALEYRDTIMVGRTHGQHATPITLGFKFANYVYELARSYERICSLENRLIRAKLGGATGTLSAYGEKALEVRRIFSEKLGLEPHPISTQVAPRDSFAELAYILAILASQLDRLAVEIRELSRPEIGELWEERPGAISSSSMPQKNNPVTAERITGLARTTRTLAHGLLENIVLWHERDLSNSSTERILLPHILLVVDQILTDTQDLLDRLIISPENMKKNIEKTMYTTTAEALMNKLIEKGLARKEAYTLARHATGIAIKKKIPLWEAALSIPEIKQYLDDTDLEELLRPENYIGQVNQLISSALSYYRDIVDKCEHTK